MTYDKALQLFRQCSENHRVARENHHAGRITDLQYMSARSALAIASAMLDEAESCPHAHQKKHAASGERVCVDCGVLLYA